MGLFNRRSTRRADQFNRESSRAMMPRYTSPPTRNTTEWMAAFGKSPRLAPIEKIASDLSYVTGKLYQVDRHGNKREITEHPFLDFWSKPNPMVEFTASAVWKLHAEYLLLKGEGYAIIERYGDGTPAELWPVPVQWVQQTPYVGYPFYDIRTTSGNMLQVSVDDMFVQRDLNPLDPYRRGLGQAEAVADEVEIDEYAAKFQKNFFFNGATPDTVVVLPGADESQVNRFLAKWKEKFQGVAQSHGLAVLAGPKDGSNPVVEKLSDNMKDLDMVNGRMFTRDVILEHFGMPREIMGITENSNRATADAAQYIYAKNVLKPRLIQRQDAVNQQLVGQYGDDLLWEYDDVIPRNEEFDKGKAMEGWTNGLFTRNQSLELLDMETCSNGDVYKVSMADMYVNANTDLAGMSSMMSDVSYEDPEQIEIEGISQKSDVRQRWVKAASGSLDVTRRKQERKFQAAASSYLNEQGKRLAHAFGAGTKADGDIWDDLKITEAEYLALSETEQKKLINDFINGLLNWESESKMLEAFFRPLWSETYGAGAEATKKLYKLNNIEQPALASTARIKGGQRVTRVTKATKDAIGQIITAGIEEGKGKQQLADEIAEAAKTSDKRARLIAAQECNTSLLAGNFDMAKAGGFSQKTWHITNAGKARDTHRLLNGKTVSINEPFVTAAGNKLMMPCDPDSGVAEETVNCHCFLTYS